MKPVPGPRLALILYLVAKKFKVEEDPRIDEVDRAADCDTKRCESEADAEPAVPKKKSTPVSIIKNGSKRRKFITQSL